MHQSGPPVLNPHVKRHRLIPNEIPAEKILWFVNQAIKLFLLKLRISCFDWLKRLRQSQPTLRAIVLKLVIQLVYTMFITNNHDSFHLYWQKILVKYQKILKYYGQDCSEYETFFLGYASKIKFFSSHNISRWLNMSNVFDEYWI